MQATWPTVGPYSLKAATRLVTALRKQGATQVRMQAGDYGYYVSAVLPAPAGRARG